MQAPIEHTKSYDVTETLNIELKKTLAVEDVFFSIVFLLTYMKYVISLIKHDP